MSDTSDQQKSTDSSIATFTSSLIFNIVLSVGIFVGFDILRKRNKKVYEPRTYLVPEKVRSEPLPSGLFAWVLPVLKVPDEVIIKRIGLDSYMFLRYMKMCTTLFAILSVFGLAVLLPINSVNQGNGLGLEKFTIGNVRDTKRLWAHVILTWLFSGITMYILYREFKTFIRLRHEYHTTDEYRNSPRASTILVTGIPEEINNTESLKALFNIFPGGVKRIWLNRDPSNLAKVTAKREATVLNLEGAATNYIIQHAEDKSKPQSKESNAENGNSSNIKRPQHNSGMPIIGKKVDSLETYSNDLNNLNQQISELQKNPNDFKRLNSAFIQFNNYVGAQLAATSTIPKLTNISPDDVIWENLNLTNAQRMIRKVISLIVVIALVIIWIPAATFIASISTLSELAKLLPFLNKLNNVDSAPLSALVGIIQGILPAVALSILMWLLPIILRFLSRFEGIVTNSGVDFSLQSKYYFHLVVNVLLVTSFANGVFKSLPELLQNPTKSVEILANNLPRASTFFLTYVLLTITSCALEILQIAPLILNFIFKRLLVKTPRKIWELERTMPFQDWGTGFPPHVLIASIGLVYSVVQPIILPIVTLHFALYYLVFRHQLLYVYNKLNQTGGLLFPRGIYQMFTGIYIFQLTLIGLMFLNQGFAQGILCIVLLILSVGVLLAMRHTFKHNPRAEFLPVDLMGIVDMKTRKVLVGENQKFSLKKEPVRNDDNNDDDNYTNPDVLHINEGDEDDLKDNDENTFMHPAIVAVQPSVWIPNDQNISNDMIDDFRKDGIKATNQGASLNEKYKVAIDIDKIPLEFRDDEYSKQKKADKKKELGQLKNRIVEIEEEIGENP